MWTFFDNSVPILFINFKKLIICETLIIRETGSADNVHFKYHFQFLL